MRVRLCAVLGVLSVMLPVGAAQAKNLSSLDTSPATPGRVVEDAAGNAYVAWVHDAGSNSNFVMFCKIPPGGKCTSPVSLPDPGATAGDPTLGITGAFPILDGTTVFIVAPRYVPDDVVLYESVGGGPFTSEVFPSSTTAGAGPYSNKSGPSNAFLIGGDTFAIGANNAGVGFSEFGAHQGNFTFTDPGGTVADSSMAIDPSGNLVLAYYNLASGAENPILFYRSASGSASDLTNQSTWSSSPVLAAHGQEPRLAGGASGLVMAANEYPNSSASVPTLLTVRKWNGAGFGGPVVLTNDKSTGLFDAGAAAQTPGGHVLVAWPTARIGDLENVMRLYVSTNGGASFAGSVDIAKIGEGYNINDNAQLAGSDNGQGWLTFLDDHGLELADFGAIPPYVPPPYKGPTKSATGKVMPGVKVVVTAPKSCVRQLQKFRFSAVLKVKRQRGRKVTIKKVVFSLDGKKLRTLSHKPFRVTLTLGTAAHHSVHRLSAKLTVVIKRKHHRPRTVTRTVKVKVPVC